MGAANTEKGFEGGTEPKIFIYFYHPDASTTLSTCLGTNTYLTDMEGQPYQLFINLPFGETMAEQTGTGYQSPYKFNGKELDPETGLYYYGARYYDPQSSTWLSVDPLAEKYAGWTPYNYCIGNPVVFVDPDGNNVSTHTDKDGNVVKVYDDGDLGVYKHDGNMQQTKEELAKCYSENNKSGGGEHMGWTLYAKSFQDDKGNDVGKIEYGSFAAQEWIDKSENEVKSSIINVGSTIARYEYALNAGNKDYYDFKTQNGKGFYSGSQISANVYVSARDAGNYLAGSVAKLTGQSKLSFMLTAGAFNLHGNSKIDLVLNLRKYKSEAARLAPKYGEDERSNHFQRLGYEAIRTISDFNQRQSDIWRDRR